MGTRKVEQIDLGKDPSPAPTGQLKVLTEVQVRQIDALLAKLGPFAEVRLVKEQGRLHSIRKVESESVLPPYHQDNK